MLRMGVPALSSKYPDEQVTDTMDSIRLSRNSSMLWVLVLASTTITACAIPQEGSVRSIDPAKIPYELNVTTTSTTVRTEPSTTTSAPDDDGGSSPSVESVNLYFVSGPQVVPITRLLLSPAAAGQVLASLVEGLPPGDEAAGLRTAIPSESDFEVIVERGIARVDLPLLLTSAIPGSEQRLAVAQIVLTLTRRAGIGQVVFTSGGRPQSVPRGRGDLTQPGGAVACEDYANLLPAGFSC